MAEEQSKPTDEPRHPQRRQRRYKTVQLKYSSIVMPTSVEEDEAAAKAEAIATGKDLPGDISDLDPKELDEGDEEDEGAGFFTAPEDRIDYSHLTDDFVGPLYVYPSSDPSKEMKAAYVAQKAAKATYDTMRKQREEHELNMAEELGRLHNLIRESREREDAARKKLREKTIAAYELELQEPSTREEFTDWIFKLKKFVKTYKGLPVPPEELERDAWKSDPNYETLASLSRWVRARQEDYASLAPNQLAALQNLGVTFPLTEEDEWHRSLHQFQLYSKEYWESPIKVQSTNGDLVGSVMDSTQDKWRALRIWCLAQRELYEQDCFEDKAERYTKLVNAGFTFDVITDDDKWNEAVEVVANFRSKFGHVHVPQNYVPQDSTPNIEALASRLPAFVDKVRTLLHRDALSPKRVSHLKKLGLYLDMGGRVSFPSSRPPSSRPLGTEECA